MAKRVFVTSIVLILATVSLVAKKKTESDPVFADVTARGRALYEYDQAAWHATDALQASHPATGLLGRYVAHNSGVGWTVSFGRLNEPRDKFLVGYEATQGAKAEEYTIKAFDPPREDTAFCLSAAKAIETALHDFQGQNRPYNVALLPAPSGQLYVYVFPAQTRTGEYPLGGDARYLLTADGNTIVQKRQLHKGILENRGDLPKGATPAGGFHTHVLSEVPEDTDVFYVLHRKPPMPEMIGTMNRKLYKISPDGTIREGKM